MWFPARFTEMFLVPRTCLRGGVAFPALAESWVLVGREGNEVGDKGGERGGAGGGAGETKRLGLRAGGVLRAQSQKSHTNVELT